MCIVAWMKRAVPEKTKAAVVGACTTLITAFACLTVFVVTETALDIRQVFVYCRQDAGRDRKYMYAVQTF